MVHDYKYRILGMDGGGIRAIIQAVILEEIEVRTKTSISNLFDLIVGTSAGAIVAAALTTPYTQGSQESKYSAYNIIELFSTQSKNIFKPKSNFGIVNKINNFISSKYKNQSKEELFMDWFGYSLLEDSLTEVLITTYDTQLRQPILFSSNIGLTKINKGYRILSSPYFVYEVLMGATAAPTFFPPYNIIIPSSPYGKYCLIDGGIYANNPTNLGIVSALNKGYKLEDLTVLSLGTGSLTDIYHYDEVKSWGLINWAAPIIDILLDGQPESAHLISESLVKEYLRIQGSLTKSSDKMDNVDNSNIKSLINLAKELIYYHSDDIDKICESLV